MGLKETLARQGDWLFRYRSYLPLLILPLMLWALPRSIHFTDFCGPVVIRIYNLICILIALVGLIVRILTVGYTPRGTSGRNTKQQRATVLNTKGMYALVRHPLYLGNFLIYLGIILFVKVGWFILIAILLFWIYYERIMLREEEFLRKKFGEEYSTWAAQTPAFIPRLNNWQRPDFDFSWRKVIKKEVTGLVTLVLAFTLIRLLINLFNRGQFRLSAAWVVFLILGCVLYLSVRVIRLKTNWLKVSR